MSARASAAAAWCLRPANRRVGLALSRKKKAEMHISQSVGIVLQRTNARTILRRAETPAGDSVVCGIFDV